ncbi:MAG: YdcF family protein [Candidatus Pacebacteria bacterium]|nr:YdcF family protein [Candidatus Paceibacterota bacterium]
MKKTINITKKIFLFGVAGIILWNAVVIVISEIYTLRKNQNINTALVLGAGVLDDGSMSPYLEDRVNAAIALYDNEQIENILVSGDNSRNTYNEVEPVKDYLLRQGVFSGDIYLDHAGFDTYDSLYRAKHIFGQEEIVIISQDYHIPRAVMIGRMLGIKTYGYPSEEYNGTIKYRIREIAARVKIIYDFIFLNDPEFRGEKIEIE